MSDVAAVLKRKVGPFPLGVWVAVGAGGVLFAAYRRRNTPADTGAATPAEPPASDAFPTQWSPPNPARPGGGNLDPNGTPWGNAPALPEPLPVQQPSGVQLTNAQAKTVEPTTPDYQVVAARHVSDPYSYVNELGENYPSGTVVQDVLYNGEVSYRIITTPDGNTVTTS